MANLTLDDLTQRALSLDIMNPAQLQEMWTTFGTQNLEPELFMQESVKKGFLTNYQVERLLNNETTGFFFGDYKVLYHLGAGTFARVYRATHKDTGKIVAVKVLRARFNDNPTIINHFVHEAELGIELRHPNIVPIYEVKSVDKLHYMVMDFVEGQTLREFLKVRKKVDAKVSTRIVTDICSGLDYAFKRGLQHRDLKLSNVLLSSMGKAMLVDFGLAAITENTDLSGHSDIRNQRSIDYAALERTTGVKRDDKRSDIYFLGCVYYHLLTGEAPLLETKDRAKRADKNRFYNVKPIQSVDPMIPRAVTLVVNKAMSLDVEKRYQSMNEMLADLEVCARRLADGTANDGITAGQIDLGLAKSAPVIPKEKQKSIMIVDSNTELQGVFRESLKKAGYRVLVATSPERAVDRLLDDVSAADSVLFNAQSLGRSALDAFNKLAADSYTAKLPMIILLDERQGDFVAEANRDKHRIVLAMPITMKVMKDNIARLLGTLPPELPPAPQVEIPLDFLTPAEPAPETSDEQFETHDYIFENEDENKTENGAEPVAETVDEDEEDENDEAEAEELDKSKKPFGYKEMLAQRDDEPDPIADALFEANVPSLIKIRSGTAKKPQTIDSIPAAEPVSDTPVPVEPVSEISETNTTESTSIEPVVVEQSVESAVEKPVAEQTYHDDDFELQLMDEIQSVEVQAVEISTSQSEEETRSSDSEQHTQLEDDVVTAEPADEQVFEKPVEQPVEQPTEQVEIATDILQTQPEPEPQPQPEPQVDPYQEMSIEQLREAVSSARLQFAEATRAEEEVNRKAKEAAAAKRQAEEEFRIIEAKLLNAKSQLEHATEKADETHLMLESIDHLEVESRQTLEEATKSKEHAETVLAASQEVLQQMQEELKQHEESHKNAIEEASAASIYFDQSQGAQTRVQELKSELEAAIESLENASKSTETSISEAAEVKSKLENFASNLETLNLQFAEVQSKAQSAADEYEAATAFEKDAKSNAENLLIQAEVTMDEAIAMEKAADEAEEAARIAAEKAVIARSEAKQAMILAGDARIKSDSAAEEAQAAEIFVAESSQKMEAAKIVEEETRTTLKQAEEEMERLKTEAEEKEKIVFDITTAEEEARKKWEDAKKAHENSERELTEALIAAGVAEELRNRVEQLTADKETVSKRVEEAEEEVKKARLVVEETEKYEEECKLQLEKTVEEVEKHKKEAEVAKETLQEAQKAFDESSEAHRKAEAELQEAIAREEEIIQRAKDKSAEKEKARSAAESAKNALSALEGGDASESTDTAEPGTGTFKTQTTVEDRVAAAIRARVEAALAARKNEGK